MGQEGLGCVPQGLRVNRGGDSRGFGFIDPRRPARGRFYRGFWVFTFSHTKSSTNVLMWKKVHKLVQMYYSTNDSKSEQVTYKPFLIFRDSLVYN